MIPAAPSTFHSILEIYQAGLVRGEYAQVVLETEDGKQKVAFYPCETGYPILAKRERNSQARKRGLPLILQEAGRGEKPG
jgi:hypothetical protein